MNIKNFKELKKFIENKTPCKVEEVTPNKFNILEPFRDSLDGIGYDLYEIEHDGTIESMIQGIKNEYIGYNIYGNIDYYGQMVKLLGD